MIHEMSARHEANDERRICWRTGRYIHDRYTSDGLRTKAEFVSREADHSHVYGAALLRRRHRASLRLHLRRDRCAVEDDALPDANAHVEAGVRDHPTVALEPIALPVDERRAVARDHHEPERPAAHVARTTRRL